MSSIMKVKSMGKEKKKRKPWQLVLIWLARIVGIIVICFALLLTFLTVTEYRPAAQENITVETSGQGKTLTLGSSISVMTWNAGYGALGDNADFFMDGGKSVKTADQNRVNINVLSIADEINKISPDFMFLQEVDVASSRSYNTNEVEMLKSMTSAKMTDSTFAYNFKVAFIPYPIPPIGKVNSGILTLSKYAIEDSTRYQLPTPFKWPVRLGNLKRCLMVDKVPVNDANGKATGKYLVLVNLHLEAYDSGEGKAAQTKMLNDILQAESDAGNYVIAGGDFNQTFSGTDSSMYPEQEGKWHCGKIEESDFSSDWQFEMDNSTPTCRSLDQAYAGADQKNFQYYMIDGFIVSKNIEVSSVKTQSLSFANSDHNPVLLQVKLGN